MPEPIAPVKAGLTPGYKPESGDAPPSAAHVVGGQGVPPSAAPQGSTAPGAGVGGETGTPQTQEVTIDLGGGVVRKVPMTDLARLVATEHEIGTTRAEADRLLQRNAAAAALTEHLEAMSDEDRSTILAAIQNPDQFLRRAQPTQQPTDPHTPRQAPTTAPTAMDKRLAELERNNELLTQFVRQELSARQEQTTASRIDAEMGAFPVFKESDEGRSYAKGAIATELAANPKADLRAVVAKHAAHMHRMMQGSRSVAPSMDPRGGPVPITAPTKPFSGDDLASGGIAKSLIDQFFGPRR